MGGKSVRIILLIVDWDLVESRWWFLGVCSPGCPVIWPEGGRGVLVGRGMLVGGVGGTGGIACTNILKPRFSRVIVLRVKNWWFDGNGRNLKLIIFDVAWIVYVLSTMPHITPNCSHLSDWSRCWRSDLLERLWDCGCDARFVLTPFFLKLDLISFIEY